jgi:hypothetical protein
MTKLSVSLEDINPDIDMKRDIIKEIEGKAREVKNAYRHPEYLLISLDLYLLLLSKLNENGLIRQIDDIDIINVGEWQIKVILVGYPIKNYFDISYSLNYGNRKIDLLNQHPKTKREENVEIH